MYRKFGQENLEEQVEIKKKMVDLLGMEKKQEKEKRMFDLRHNLELLDMIQSKESTDLLDSVISSVQDFVNKYKESVYTKGKSEPMVQTVDVGNCPYKKIDMSKDIHLGSLCGLKNEKDHSSVYNVGNNGVQLKGGRRVMTGVRDHIRGSLPVDAEKETKLDKVYGRPVNVGSCRYKTLGGSGKEANTTRVGLPFLKDGLTLPSDVSTMDMKGKDDNKKSYAYTLGNPKSDTNNKHKGNYRVYSDEQSKTLKDKEVKELINKIGSDLHCPYERHDPSKMVEESTPSGNTTKGDCNRRKRIEMCANQHFGDISFYYPTLGEHKLTSRAQSPHNWTAKDLMDAKRMLKQFTLPESKTSIGCERPLTSYGCKPKRGISVPWYKLHWKNAIKRDDEKKERIGSFIRFPKQSKHILTKKRNKKEFLSSVDRPLDDRYLGSAQVDHRMNSFISFSIPQPLDEDSPLVNPPVNKCTKEEEYILTWDDVDEDVINFIPRNNCDPFP